MRVVITATTEKGSKSTEEDVSKTFKEVMKIVKAVGGAMVYGRGFHDGTEVVLEK